MSSYFLRLRDSRSMNTLSSHRPPVHRDADAGTGERSGEGCAGDLAALVRIEDVGLAEAGERRLESRDAKRHVHRVGEPTREHGAAHPVHHRDEVAEAPPD